MGERVTCLMISRARSLYSWESAIHFYCQYHYVLLRAGALRVCHINTYFVERAFFRSISPLISKRCRCGIFCAEHDLTPAFSELWFIWPDWYRVSCNFVGLCVPKQVLAIGEGETGVYSTAAPACELCNSSNSFLLQASLASNFH